MVEVARCVRESRTAVVCEFAVSTCGHTVTVVVPRTRILGRGQRNRSYVCETRFELELCARFAEREGLA